MSYLITIAIFGLVLSVFCWHSRRKKKAKAFKDISELAKSIRHFYKIYNYYPITDFTSDEQSGGSVMDILLGKQWVTGHPYSNDVSEKNPKLINFVKYFLHQNTINDMIIDPWGKPYRIAFDTNGDGITEINKLLSGEETIKKIHAPFIIWSDGPDHKNNLCDGDDIYIWG